MRIPMWFEKMTSGFWNYLILHLGIHDIRSKQYGTQKHCHVLDDRLKLIENTVKIGVDVAQREHDSWAVICIHGKQDYVQFIKLPSNDIQEIQRFISRFKKEYNVVVDCPPCAKHLF